MKITPQQFAIRMKKIYDNDDLDVEREHIEADALMCLVLRHLGYAEGVEIFVNAPKWYA